MVWALVWVWGLALELFFFNSPGRTTHLKHGFRAGDAQMTKTTPTWKVREEKRRTDLEKHCSQVFSGRGRGHWEVQAFKEKRGKFQELE